MIDMLTVTFLSLLALWAAGCAGYMYRTRHVRNELGLPYWLMYRIAFFFPVTAFLPQEPVWADNVYRFLAGFDDADAAHLEASAAQLEKEIADYDADQRGRQTWCGTAYSVPPIDLRKMSRMSMATRLALKKYYDDMQALEDEAIFKHLCGVWSPERD